LEQIKESVTITAVERDVGL